MSYNTKQKIKKAIEEFDEFRLDSDKDGYSFEDMRRIAKKAGCSVFDVDYFVKHCM